MSGMHWAREYLNVPHWWFPQGHDRFRLNVVMGRLMENVRR
jgi:hypothetical protein